MNLLYLFFFCFVDAYDFTKNQTEITLTPNEAIRGRKKKEIYNAQQVTLAINKRKAQNLRLKCEKLCPHVQPIYLGRRRQKLLNDWATQRVN
jgi:hypothetical protein